MAVDEYFAIWRTYSTHPEPQCVCSQTRLALNQVRLMNRGMNKQTKMWRLKACSPNQANLAFVGVGLGWVRLGNTWLDWVEMVRLG
jgi:hypothetical protein